jgi:hypothetical protein
MKCRVTCMMTADWVPAVICRPHRKYSNTVPCMSGEIALGTTSSKHIQEGEARQDI